MTGLRILHLGKYYPPAKGGIETVVETLCRGELAEAQPRALVLGKGRATTAAIVDGVPVRRIGRLATLGAVSLAPALLPWLAREAAQADVLVLHEPNPMALLAYYLVRPATPLVVWYHSEVIRPQWRYRLLYQPLLEFALRRAARIVVASPPMLDVTALAPHRAKGVVVPFGLPIERYALTPAVSARAEALRTVAGKPTLLFVGRLVPYKGVEVLLRALPGLDVDTVIVGDGPRRSALESMARDRGVGGRVRFLGEVTGDELLAWYHRCDALVLPSITRQEAFGMVQLEAMLCGRPVISTELGTGVSWVNQHGRTGLVVRPDDAGELREALVRLTGDPALARRLGEAARARVLDAFNAERMCRSTVALYREVAGAAPSVPGARAAWRGALWAKRSVDVALSGLGLMASAPLWALIAILIKIEDGGPVFYDQERSGLNAVPFRVRKFRSMIPDAEADVGAVQAAEHDPRVTRVGRLLRATAMDELPQLWNIFRGDMSFAGPRALRPGEIETLGSGRMERLEDVPGFAARASVRPGLTGVAQIFAPRDIPRRLKFRYDLLYVRRQSLWLDVRLIALSFWITFRGSWEVRGSKF